MLVHRSSTHLLGLFVPVTVYYLCVILSITLVLGTQDTDERQSTSIFRPLQRLEQNVKIYHLWLVMVVMRLLLAGGMSGFQKPGCSNTTKPTFRNRRNSKPNIQSECGAHLGIGELLGCTWVYLKHHAQFYCRTLRSICII